MAVYPWWCCCGKCKCASGGFVKLTATGIQSGGVDYSSFAPIDTWSHSYPDGSFADGDYFVPDKTGSTECEYQKFRNDYGTAKSIVYGPTGSGVIGCNRDIIFNVRFLGTRTIILIYLVGTRYLVTPPFDDRHLIFFADSAVAAGTVNMDGSVTFANLIASPSTVISGTTVDGTNYFYGGTITLACVAPEDVVADADGGSDDECVQPVDPGEDCEACGSYSFSTVATAAMGYDYNDDGTSRNWSGSLDMEFRAIYSDSGKTYAYFSSWETGSPSFGTDRPSGPYAEALFNCTDDEWAASMYVESGGHWSTVTFLNRSGPVSGVVWANTDGGYTSENDETGTVTVVGNIGITVGNACET